jgi:hypothetical protein
LFGILWPHAGSHPASELFSTQLSGCKPQNDPLLLINSGIEFVTVQDQEHFHRKMPNPLVAIDEGMIADQREAQGGGFGRQAWMQILPLKRHLRLSNSRLKAAQIAHLQARQTAGARGDEAPRPPRATDTESCEPPIKLSILLQQMIRSFLKLNVRPIEQLLNATPQKLLRRQPDLLGPQAQLSGSLIG